MDGIQSSFKGAGFSLDYSSTKLLERNSNETNGPIVQPTHVENMAFSLELSNSLKVAEGETRRSLASAYSMKFSFSMEKLMGESVGEDHPVDPKATAGRILDFVATAFDEGQKFADEFGGDQSAIADFLETSEEAIYAGFASARDLLGELDSETDSKMSETLELVLGGLENLFADDDGEAPPKSPQPTEGQFYSTKSFSLAYQVKIQADGLFHGQELQEFVQESMARVQAYFNSLMRPDELSSTSEGNEPQQPKSEQKATDQSQPDQPLRLFQMTDVQVRRMRALLATQD